MIAARAGPRTVHRESGFTNTSSRFGPVDWRDRAHVRSPLRGGISLTRTLELSQTLKGCLVHVGSRCRWRLSWER